MSTKSEIPWARRTDAGWLLDVHVQPGARRSEVAGLHGGRLKIRVVGTAQDGRANAELVRHVADRLGVPRRAVRIVRGTGSRTKTLEVIGLANPASLSDR